MRTFDDYKIHFEECYNQELYIWYMDPVQCFFKSTKTMISTQITVIDAELYE